MSWDALMIDDIVETIMGLVDPCTAALLSMTSRRNLFCWRQLVKRGALAGTRINVFVFPDGPRIVGILSPASLIVHGKCRLIAIKAALEEYGFGYLVSFDEDCCRCFTGRLLRHLGRPTVRDLRSAIAAGCPPAQLGQILTAYCTCFEDLRIIPTLAKRALDSDNVAHFKLLHDIDPYSTLRSDVYLTRALRAGSLHCLDFICGHQRSRFGIFAPDYEPLADCRNPEVFSYLLQLGLRTFAGRCLGRSIERDNPTLLEWLSSISQPLTTQQARTCFAIAIRKGATACLTLLLRNYAQLSPSLAQFKHADRAIQHILVDHLPLSTSVYAAWMLCGRDVRCDALRQYPSDSNDASQPVSWDALISKLLYTIQPPVPMHPDVSAFFTYY